MLFILTMFFSCKKEKTELCQNVSSGGGIIGFVLNGLLLDYGIDFLNLDNYTVTALDEWCMLTYIELLKNSKNCYEK